jgi:hypothetical protein
MALLGLSRGRWGITLPIPVILAWPLVGLALGGVWLWEAGRDRGQEQRPPGLAKTALLAFCQLHGLKVDIQSARGRRVRLWML